MNEKKCQNIKDNEFYYSSKKTHELREREQLSQKNRAKVFDLNGLITNN